MSPTKVLNINPDFFTLKQSNHSKTAKKEKKQKPIEIKSASSMRKTLLAKIRDYQTKEDKKKEENKGDNQGDKEKKEEHFENEFNKSLNFLQEIANKHKDKHKNKNKSLKKQLLRSKEQIVNIDLPEALLDIPPVISHTNMNFSHQIPTSIDNSLSLSSIPIGIHSSEIPSSYIPLEQPSTIDNSISSKPFIKPSNIQIQIRDPSDLSTSLSPKIDTLSNITIPEIQIPKIDIQDIQDIPTIRDTSISSSSPLSSVSLSKEIKKDKHRKLKETIINHSNNITLKNPPPDSNLKGGNKPTFREWNKTYKSYDTPNTKIMINEKQRKKDYKKKITRNIRTIKYNLGKKDGRINVLIKNNNTMKKIKHELLTLRKKNILEVKDYLHQKNLIKSGTLAPNDVLREIYEQSILSGDIVNENKQNLFHNFFNNKD